MDRYFASMLLLWTALLANGTAQATAGRTFVSTAGVDTNTTVNCGPTTPCRTFGAALSVTASGGEIVVLNSGGYGPAPINITQSVSITAPDGVYAGLTVPSGSGITIAGTGISVALKGLTINGTGGARGIEMTDGAILTVVNCVIAGFSVSALTPNGGIYVNTPAQVRLVNVIVRDSFYGIVIDGGATATISKSQVLGSSATGIGIFNDGTSGRTVAFINDSIANGNGVGVNASGLSASATAAIYAVNVVASGNISVGFQAGANSTLVVVSGSAMDNGQFGFFNLAGTFNSAGNNTLAGNAQAPTSGTITTGGLTF